MEDKEKTWRKKLDGYFIAFCRRTFAWSPYKRDALAAAKVGKEWRCANCGKLYIKVHVDHTQPVVPVDAPWDRDWNTYRERMNTRGVKVLCVACHKIKTGMEAKDRKKFRQERDKDNAA